VTNKEAMKHAITKIETIPEISQLFAEMKEISPATFNHSINVGNICFFIGQTYGLRDRDLKELMLTGMLHDIGKLKIPTEILNCPGTLTQDQFMIMKNHAEIGAELCKKFSRKIRRGILEHHENHNGTGYPDGKHDKEISLFGKILRIADVSDAMMSKRAYKDAMAQEKVCEYLKSDENDLFDPYILSIYFDIVGYKA